MEKNGGKQVFCTFLSLSCNKKKGLQVGTIYKIEDTQSILSITAGAKYYKKEVSW